jgi:protein arginine N-methyltransferase 3
LKKPTPQEANDLTGQEAFLTADEYLKPVLQDDPMLRMSIVVQFSHHLDPDTCMLSELDFDEPWSEDDDQETTAEAPGSSHAPTKTPTDLSAALKKIHALEKKLSQTTSELSEVRSFVTKRLDSELFTSDTTESITPAPRDDDSHYFESYGSNGEARLRSSASIY